MRRLTRDISLAIFGAFAAIPTTASAQAPPGADKLTRAAVAESLSVLRQIDARLLTNPKDAPAWYRRGMVAWALYERDRNTPPISGLDWTQLGRMADTSLRIAAELDERNAQYRLMAGRFLLNSGVSATRVASYGMFEAALEAARKSEDPHVHAETAIEAGRLFWRRYDTYADRWLGLADKGGASSWDCPYLDMPTQDMRASVAGDWRAAVDEAMRQCKAGLLRGSDFYGEADYVQAETLFREAFEAQPSFDRAYKQFAMLLAARYRWRELENAARMRLAAAPWDAGGWLTLALSVHRQRGNARLVRAAFDSAFTLMPKDEIARLDRLERVLKPKDTTRIRSLDSATHAVTTAYYWQSADPLWARDGNEPRTEFLARLTYAELRWTAEEMKVRGADTDRGDVYIRYGPPDLIVAKSPEPGSAEVKTDWAYNNGLVFRFAGALTFATARIPPEDEQMIGDIQAGAPVTWDNTREISVDTMPAQAVRFRAAHDSVDLFLATMPPVDAIRNNADIAGDVRTDFYLLANGLMLVARDSGRMAVPGTRVFQHRVAPGLYTYRAEASADGGRYAARASSVVVAGRDTVTGFTTRGFGLSDILMTSRAVPRGTVTRWNDLNIQPLTGSALRKSQVTLVWETYEAGSAAGSAHYDVTVTIQRTRGTAGRIAAQVIGRVGSAVGMDRSEDKVAIHFERNVAHAHALVDNVALALGDTPAGSYRVTVNIADRVTGRSTSRTANLTVVDPPAPPPRR